MTKTCTIEIWAGCDPQLAKAINAFSEKWGPYSDESRKYSIFGLIRELIDPAWKDLQLRFPALKSSLMDRSWSRCFEYLEPVEPEDESLAKMMGRAKSSVIPCGGKIDGAYILSALARHHGFTVLDRFIQSISRARAVPALAGSFDSLRELALACRSKKSKKKTIDFPGTRVTPSRDKHGAINARRANLHHTCKLCGRQTEVSAHVEGAPWPLQDPDVKLRLSAHYCDVHRPKAPFSDLVRGAYLRAKRSQSKFDVEFSRLERQILGGPSRAWAKSGNKLVDEYIRLYVTHQLQGSSLDLGKYLLDRNYADFLEMKVRDEARMMVDQKVSDRKKEIMMLLVSGLNQTATGLQLGIERQAVSKALQSIRPPYRLDLVVRSINTITK